MFDTNRTLGLNEKQTKWGDINRRAKLEVRGTVHEILRRRLAVTSPSPRRARSCMQWGNLREMGKNSIAEKVEYDIMHLLVDEFTDAAVDYVTYAAGGHIKQTSEEIEVRAVEEVKQKVGEVSSRRQLMTRGPKFKTFNKQRRMTAGTRMVESELKETMGRLVENMERMT